MQFLLFWGGFASMCLSGCLWLAERVSIDIIKSRQDAAAVDVAEANYKRHVMQMMKKNEAKGRPEAIPEPTPELADPWDELQPPATAARGTTGW
ncbi:hypothetical protein [Botrimarina mediterranea]|uniref:hypothetical protein n=1 Tax=Botrimarina mediterranea TaxID=2528022 RepID=UPI00118BE1AA|nr:hypothetical protein K2D_12820 [Planctomycetes bacterium K2D]